MGLKSSTGLEFNFELGIDIMNEKSNIEINHNVKIPWSKSSGFFNPLNSSAMFTGWLVEPCLDKTLPIFMKVPIRDHIIPLTHFGSVTNK